MFLHYEINTAGDDNSKKMGYSTPIFGLWTFLLLVLMETLYPPEPEDWYCSG